MIINADDFGLCEGVNKAIFEAHSYGALTSATIMAGMPGFDEAVEMSKMLPSLGVGVHLNVVEGMPVSRDSKVKILTGNDGAFKYKPGKLAVKAFFDKKFSKQSKSNFSLKSKRYSQAG
jgi:predicted glycoside hydrolase/deacetylase ChbG (UPF0249 family)